MCVTASDCLDLFGAGVWWVGVWFSLELGGSVVWECCLAWLLAARSVGLGAAWLALLAMCAFSKPMAIYGSPPFATPQQVQTRHAWSAPVHSLRRDAMLASAMPLPWPEYCPRIKLLEGYLQYFNVQ